MREEIIKDYANCPPCNNLVAFGAGGSLDRKRWKVRKEDNNFTWFREAI